MIWSRGSAIATGASSEQFALCFSLVGQSSWSFCTGRRLGLLVVVVVGSRPRLSFIETFPRGSRNPLFARTMNTHAPLGSTTIDVFVCLCVHLSERANERIVLVRACNSANKTRVRRKTNAKQRRLRLPASAQIGPTLVSTSRQLACQLACHLARQATTLQSCRH